MRTYHLFIIKSEFYQTYLTHSFSLYKTLENLYQIKREDASFGAALFHQLCEYQNEDLLNQYFREKKFPTYRKSYILFNEKRKEKTFLFIKPSRLIVVTNKNVPRIFKILNYYNYYLFVCDFKNKDYFWLSNHYKK
ncbi:MAG: sporulation inhibitor of replication protein SirA [Bacilli bacterium]|nr:sporulation inhibitor of replication protein SirA [Bacilli bacterium]